MNTKIALNGQDWAFVQMRRNSCISIVENLVVRVALNQVSYYWITAIQKWLKEILSM